MSDTYAVIMAGGSGTRFWPASRKRRPKQLLPLAGGDEPLIAATTRRLEGIVSASDTLIVTSEILADATAAAVPGLPRQNVLAEPIGRNTAPCVGWAAARVARDNPEAVIAVLPADHHIARPDDYRAVIKQAISAARSGDLVTVGIQPSRPETGYGYIEVGDPIGDGVHRARRFVEKPSRSRAEQFLAAGTFLWNSGMFFFRADAILSAIRQHLPGLSEALEEFDKAAARSPEAEAECVAARYGDLPSVSIDHGVMEKVDQVAVVPGEFGWSDVGSWTSAWHLAEKDENENALPEGAIVIDSKGSYIQAPAGKLVAVVGLEDMVVVDTEDALLIMPKARDQEVRDIVEALRARKDHRL